MLEVRGLSAWYGDVQALDRISLAVGQGQAVSVVGANAAGKSTLIRAISGMIRRVEGEIRFRGEPIGALPVHERVRRGLVHVPEGRRLFPFLTVRENLELGAFTPEARPHRHQTLEYVYSLFPVLKERGRQLAGTLSGGEQQMCTIGRGLMTRPQLLMLDEPSLGLAPIFVKKVFAVLNEIRRTGTTILLVEQNVHAGLKLADYAYVIETGRVATEGPGTGLLASDAVRRAYLGV